MCQCFPDIISVSTETSLAYKTHVVFNELSKAYPKIPHVLSVKLVPKHQCMPKSKI